MARRPEEVIRSALGEVTLALDLGADSVKAIQSIADVTAGVVGGSIGVTGTLAALELKKQVREGERDRETEKERNRAELGPRPLLTDSND